MRVRISYAVDSEDIPNEVSMLVDRSSKIADEVAEAARELSHTCIDHDLTLNELDTVLAVRDELIKLDSYLSDAAQLILGYQQMKVKQSAEKGQVEEVDTDEHNTQHGDSDLEELLERTGEISENIAEYDTGAEAF